jgi:hypothetical protein
MVMTFVVCLCCVLWSLLWYVKNYQSITVRCTCCHTIRLIGVTFWPTHTCTMPIQLNIRQSKPSNIQWNQYGIWRFDFLDSDFMSPPIENKHNHGYRQQNWPPSTQQEDMHPSMTWWIDSVQPPQQADMAFGGCWRGYMALIWLLA